MQFYLQFKRMSVHVDKCCITFVISCKISFYFADTHEAAGSRLHCMSKCISEVFGSHVNNKLICSTTALFFYSQPL